MKFTKIALSTIGAAALAAAFAGCGKTTEATNEKTAANTADNTTTTKTADKSPEAKNTPPAANKTIEAGKKSDINSIDFLNYTYQSPSCAEDLGISGKITVSKGKFKSGDNYYNVKDNNFIYADVNGDRREDAVVTIECGNSAGTFRSFEIHAFSFEDGKAKSMATLDFGQVSEDFMQYYPDGFVFSIPQNGVTVDNGKLVVDVLTDGSFAMPKNVSTFNYKLSGDGFTLESKPTKRSYKP